MVKGISRRVVVVKAPVGSIFDEAIFIMRDDLSTDIDSEELLREACSVADEYVKKNCDRKKTGKPLFFFSLLSLLLLSLTLFFFLK